MKNSNTRQALRVKPDWKANILVVVLLPCLVSLGNWQMGRAEQKRELKAQYELRQQQPALNLEQLLDEADLRYRRVRLIGQFDNTKNLFLDNRIRQGVFGYEVISLFKLDNHDSWVPVNRGWIKGDVSRRSLPVIPAISGDLELAGQVYTPVGEAFSLGAEHSSGWPRVIQNLDTNALAEELGIDIVAFSVRLDADMPAALQAKWSVVNIQPEKHTAYAFQWFAMAVALLIIALLANTNLWALITHKAND